MSTDSAGELVKSWPLTSGTWTQNPGQPGFVLERTALGNSAAKAVAHDDQARLLQAGVEGSALLFPPEFRFCAVAGNALCRPALATPSTTWAPPFGAAPLANRATLMTRGLRQTTAPISLRQRSHRRADSSPDATLTLPPHGDYEFFSIPAATRSPMLLALDAVKGMLYGWLPASQRWELLEHDGGGLLAVSRMDRMDWSCEAASDGLRSVMFLPTEEGLACLVPDGVGLSFQVHYLGGAPAIGAPVQFGEHVWAPVRTGNESLRIVSATVVGEADAVVEISAQALNGTALGQLHSPLADGRVALWPGTAGQLVLRKQARGDPEASFLCWPEGIQPAFEFGSPFLSRDGGLWQLCFDSLQGGYVYLQLGVERPERHPAMAPRLCTGSFNFRFAAKYKSAPWHDPEHGDDSATDEVVLPLLESIPSAAVLGLKLATTEGLADVLKSEERMRAELVLDDDTTQTVFNTVSVVEPWRMRIFIHEGRLWAYHPLLNRLDGWDLQT